MFAHVFSRRYSFLLRCFHVGKKFLSPEPEDILFSAICLNLRQRKWKSLQQISRNLTNPLLTRVLREFRSSPKLALEFYDWILENTVAESENRFETSCVMIHFLVNSRRFDDALSIMVNLMSVEGGNSTPVDVLNGLIRTYEACSSNANVFDALVRACTQNGDPDGAYEVINQTRAEGYWISIHALNNFMNCLLNLNEIDRFWKIYKEMDDLGYVENVNTFNLVIYSFCKENKLLEAMSVYYRMLKCGIWPNVVSFNMIIDGACKSNDMEFALKLLGKMRVMSGNCVLPNAVTYNSVINGFCKVGRLDLAEKFRDEMVKLGVDCNERTYGSLVDAYGRGGSSDEALRLCDEMTSKGLIPNTVIHNSIVYSLFKENDMDGALELLQDMVSKEVEVDRFTRAIVVTGLCRNGHGEKAVKFQKQNKVREDLVCYNTLLHHFAACGDQILGRILVCGFDLDVISFGTLIDCYLKKGKLEKAINVYDDMIKMKKTPNLVIYNSIVNGLSKAGLISEAEAVVKSMESNGFFDVVTYNTLMNEYLKAGRFEEAVEILSKNMVSLVTYNILINYLCKFGCFEKAKKVLKMMIHRGIVPDSVTYGTLIMWFSKNCGEDEVVELHDYMVVHGVIPHEEIYRCFVSPALKSRNGGELDRC